MFTITDLRVRIKKWFARIVAWPKYCQLAPPPTAAQRRRNIAHVERWRALFAAGQSPWPTRRTTELPAPLYRIQDH
jgi:hypothetical protein